MGKSLDLFLQRWPFLVDTDAGEKIFLPGRRHSVTFVVFC